MNNIEILEEFIDKVDIYFDDDIGDCAITSKIAGIIKSLIQENKELKEKINKSIEFINDDDTFFEDGESWQNVLHIERILKGE